VRWNSVCDEEKFLWVGAISHSHAWETSHRQRDSEFTVTVFRNSNGTKKGYRQEEDRKEDRMKQDREGREDRMTKKDSKERRQNKAKQRKKEDKKVERMKREGERE
jgi:hypothetical protein